MTERCIVSETAVSCQTELPELKYSWAAIFPVDEEFCKSQKSEVSYTDEISYKQKDEKSKSKADKKPK